MFTIRLLDRHGNDHATDELTSFTVGSQGIEATYTDGRKFWFPGGKVEFSLNAVDPETLK